MSTGVAVASLFLTGIAIGLVVRKRQKISLRDHWTAILWRSGLAMTIVAGVATSLPVLFDRSLGRANLRMLDDLAPTMPFAVAVAGICVAGLTYHQQKKRAS